MQKDTKITLKHLQSKKNKEKITAITAYDALFAGIFDGEVDVILVGDSLNMSFGGQKDTTSLSLDKIIYHTKAVCAKAQYSFIIADMPFGSYTTRDVALKNATKLIRQTNIDAIKVEVTPQKLPIVKSLIDEGIAVMAHIGLMPQFIKAEGGYKIKGRDSKQSKWLLDSALAFEEVGAFGLLLEGIIAQSAREITQAVQIPTIGIGSGVDCDGQILVWSDMLGFFNDFTPKFVRKYFDGANAIKDAVRKYASDVKNASFPNDDECY
ncbi:3-methyl-2-oxobutanoate hydroxymethyltransferase [Helicobacter sp. CLO-3]|uniref:3-methyl-2-oxobutanoate hydroxymethyltransferase n=1 Tax=unclassified Helicobacter TaxID=2593540 RepID=UPI00080546C9|nr:MULTISPECIES: 3-methyl-2-oxobutanoate hydroxymethyltransferase [unclassified Helicobacter]OBV29834.1 3-methyl-2-oxobutanoate hydroxymethyltransferase [Helicobacter sp. CLO-3]OHU83984.1 3-methyl-2-oxobutanoate hydroxymethyltransferase [Helicobacter sp. CLO-3]